MRGGLRRHSPLVAVLSLGAIVRLWTDIEYSALLTPDSWTYARMAFEGTPVMFAPDRPVGYPLFVELFSLWGASLATLTVAQHIAGLAAGALVYFLLLRLEVPRWMAGAATAIVVLDSSAVTLNEQSVMAETLFSLLMTATAFLAVGVRRRAWALPLSGVLLAVAATTRTMAVFAIPVFLLYAIWTAPGWRPRGLAVAGLAVTLLIYATAQGVSTGYFGLTQSDGWFLYGRVASLTSCSANDVPRETRALCKISGERGRARGYRETEDYVFGPDSPAKKLFGAANQGDAERRKYVNGLLRDWARATIRSRPRAYLTGVAQDFSNYLRPDGAVANSYLLATPAEPFFGGFNKLDSSSRNNIRELRASYFPSYERDAFASGTLRAYQRGFENPGWLVTLLSILAVLVVAVAGVARRPLRHTKETLFLFGSSFAILLGAVAFSNFQDRFVPSVLPLLVSGITLVLQALVSAVRSRRSGPRGHGHNARARER